MRLAVWLVLGVSSVYAQTCAPVRILPSGSVSGTLDNSSCQLSDATAYAPYRLDLPARGQIQIGLTTSSDFILIMRDATGASLATGTSIQRPVEAGSYTVMVDGHTPGQVGAYSVQTAFIAEPAMLCTAFPSLGLNQTSSGTLGASGCQMPDGTPYEGYWLNTPGAGTLNISVSSTGFTAAIVVRSDDGSAIASGANSAAAFVDGDSEYEVVVYTADNTGTYQIVTSFQPADSETCRAQTVLSGPAKDSASVTANSCTSLIAGSGDLSYYNYYGLTVSAVGLADIAVSSTDFSPTLNLLDDGGNVLATDSGGGGNGNSGIRIQLQPGNYTVQLFSSVASGGAYQLNYGFTPGNPQPCPAAPLSLGNSASGTLSASSCRTALGLADVYSVTLAASGTISLNLASSNFNTMVAIRDAKDNLIVMNQDVEGLGATSLTADLPAGPYTVLAAAVSGAGSYQLTTQFTAKDLPPCGFVQSMDPNTGYIANLGPGSCRGSNGQPIDYYGFTTQSDGVVALVMTSNDLDSFLTLTDASGNAMRSDDNSYGGSDSLIVQFLPAGTYRLAARAASSTVGGLYRVDVLASAGPRPPFCTSRATLAVGSGVSGNIGYTGCQYTDATFADIYQIQLSSDTAIDLQLDSGDFDAYLVLLDAKGNLVDQDDDSGGGTNARITHQLAAGTYYVVAKPFTDYTSGGAYSLSVSQLSN
jgi:hypothetical protein